MADEPVIARQIHPDFWRMPLRSGEDPYGRPSMSGVSAEQQALRDARGDALRRALLEYRNRGGDVFDERLGTVENSPLTTAAMFTAGGLPATTRRALVAAGAVYGGLEGFNYLAEDHPDAARYAAAAGLAAPAAAGFAARAARMVGRGLRAVGRFISSAVSEPTTEKVNLLREMLDYYARNGRPAPTWADGVDFNVRPADAAPNRLSHHGLSHHGLSHHGGAAHHGSPGFDDYRWLFDVPDRPADFVNYRGSFGDPGRGAAGVGPATVGPWIPPRRPPARFIGGRPFTNRPWYLPGFSERPDQAFLPNGLPPSLQMRGLTPELPYFTELSTVYGDDMAARMARQFNDQRFLRWMWGNDPEKAAAEMARFEKGRKFFDLVTEPGEIILGGSAGINLEGTVHRLFEDGTGSSVVNGMKLEGGAVLHDYDLSAYIANASRRPGLPTDAVLTPRQREALLAPLRVRENVENAPVVQKLRRLYPELRGAPFVWADYDWQFGQGAQYQPGKFIVPRSPDVTKHGNATILVTTMVDGQKVDLMLSDSLLGVSEIDPRYSTALTAFDWKEHYGDMRWSGLRPKDAYDFSTFRPYGRDNPLVDLTSGRIQFSPSSFGAGRLVTEDGFPVVYDVETFPGSGKRVPVVMNYRGEMMIAGDPTWLQMYEGGHPINNPRFNSTPADSASHPLAAIRIPQGRGIPVPQGGIPDLPYESGGSIGIYPSRDAAALADRILSVGSPVTGRQNIIKVYPRRAVDPQASLSTRLFGPNAVTGSPWYFDRVRAQARLTGVPLDGNTEWTAYERAYNAARRSPTFRNFDDLGRAFGELQRPLYDRSGSIPWNPNTHEYEFTSIDRAFRNYMYDPSVPRTMPYSGEAKPMRAVRDDGVVRIDPSSPNARQELIDAIRRNSFGLAPIGGAGMLMDEED